MSEQETLLELRKLGLSRSEAKVYLSVLQLGGELASQIARKAAVPRTNCYYILKTLTTKGLVSSSNKGSRAYYIAESPRRIVVDQRRKLSLAEALVPSLLALEKHSGGLSPKMRYFEGQAGVTSVLNLCLESRSEILRYTNTQLLIKKFTESLQEHCTKLANTALKSRIISPFNPQAESFLADYFPADYIRKNVQLLYVNPNEFVLENEVMIFDDKVSIISLNLEEQMGVVIESSVYAETSRTIFNLSWLGATSFVAQ